MLSKHSPPPPARLLVSVARACPVRLCCYVARHSRPACVRLATRDCQKRPRLLLALSAHRLGGRGLRGASVVTCWRPEGGAAADSDADVAAAAAAAGTASPLTPGGGASELAERGLITGVCEQFVDAWWRGVARGVDSATDSFSQLLIGAPRAAAAAAPAAAGTAGSSAAATEESGGGGAAAPAAAPAASAASSIDAAHRTARKHDHHLHLSWRRGHHEPKRPAAQTATAPQEQKPQPREAPAAGEATAAAGESTRNTASSTSSTASSLRDEGPPPAPAGEPEPEFVLMPDGVLHRRPLRGYGALLTQLAAQHAEYHRVQYRPVAIAANVRSGVCYVLGEFRMQDVGGLAGHPATFRISKGNCLYKFRVVEQAGGAVGAREAEAEAETGAGSSAGAAVSSGAAASGAGGSDGRRHVISRGWVRRQMTQEERDERVWDPVHVYPAPFPIERLHLTRGGRPDAAAMQEAACAWVAAQAKPRRSPPAPAAAAIPGLETAGMETQQRGAEEGGDAAAAAFSGAVTSISTLGQITSTDPHRADNTPDTISGSSSSSSSTGTDRSGSPQAANNVLRGGSSGVCGRAQKQGHGAPRLLVCSWRGLGAAAAEGAHATAAGAGAGAGAAAGGVEASEDEAESGPTRVQQHLASSVLSRECRLHDAYGIYPSPEDLRLLPGMAGAAGYGSKRSQQPVLGPEAILQRIQAQQRLTEHVEPLLHDVAVSADHNIAFVHYVNVITPAAALLEPAAAATAAPPASAAAGGGASSTLAARSGGGAAGAAAAAAAAAGGSQPAGDDAASPVRGDGGAARKLPEAPVAESAAGSSSRSSSRGGAGAGGMGAARGTAAGTPAGGAPPAEYDALLSTAPQTVPTIPDAGLGLQVSREGDSPGAVLTSSSSRSSAARIAAVSSVATAAANAASAAAQAATAAAGVATSAASAANVAATTATTAATMAATAATAAAFIAASSSQQRQQPQQQSQPALEPEAGTGAAAAGTGTGAAATRGVALPLSAGQRDGMAASAAPASLVGSGTMDAGSGGGGGGGGGDGPLMGSLDLRLQERLQDLRLAMPQVQMQMPMQMQSLEEAITVAAQRVAGAAGTAAAAASAAAAAATAVIMAEHQAQQQAAAAAAAAAATGGKAGVEQAPGAAPAAVPPPPPVPYQQENMAALLFDDDGAVTDVWLLRSPFHWERRLLRP
ncbi:hypothetical protein HXX76_006701 [Chlamydomonas incerta]|uniref:Uncharacterized protein n=1 Tax=Chlamydomonas incerta TaxID=51695 RepID=A0A835T2Y7_CHLIN|nr:hypothetical protein HXX76_006701 [Chlamydomonas incerta]|eukprot:KAG2436396.1 hypothetical protein HXX76_006701 [Chlamydomonas incerta]